MPLPFAAVWFAPGRLQSSTSIGSFHKWATPPCPSARRSRYLQARSPRVSFSTNLGHGDAWIDVWTNLQSGDARALSAGARFSPEGRCATASRDRSDVHHSEEPRAGRGDRILGCSTTHGAVCFIYLLRVGKWCRTGALFTASETKPHPTHNT